MSGYFTFLVLVAFFTVLLTILAIISYEQGYEKVADQLSNGVLIGLIIFGVAFLPMMVVVGIFIVVVYGLMTIVGELMKGG